MELLIQYLEGHPHRYIAPRKVFLGDHAFSVFEHGILVKECPSVPCTREEVLAWEKNRNR